jgi:L-malate glycosyltransferase
MLVPRDATGNHTLLLRQALLDAGWHSEIFAQALHPEVEDQGFPLDALSTRTSGSDLFVYQFSSASPIVDVLLARPEPFIINFHNVTPAHFFESWDDDVVRTLNMAHEQLRMLAPQALLGIADSSYNAASLQQAGCSRTAVVPVLASFDRGGCDPDPRTLARLAAAPGTQWLFVGRAVPSKAQHHLLAALWLYRRLYDPSAHLHLVGAAGQRDYVRALRLLAARLGLLAAVTFVEDVDDASLVAYYRGADVYVSLSEHEGFGVPLVESMTAGLPVVAFGAGALPETAGRGALVLERPDPAATAAAVHRVMTDPGLRQRMVEAGRQRAEELSLVRSQARAVELITAEAEAEAEAGAIGRNGLSGAKGPRTLFTSRTHPRRALSGRRTMRGRLRLPVSG